MTLYEKGTLPAKSDIELDRSLDSTKSIVHARENLAHLVPKLQEYHTCAYLSFEISAFISVL